MANLGWVDFDLNVPPSCLAAQPLLPNSRQWSTQNSSRPNPVHEHMGHSTLYVDDSFIIPLPKKPITTACLVIHDSNHESESSLHYTSYSHLRWRSTSSSATPGSRSCSWSWTGPTAARSTSAPRTTSSHSHSRIVNWRVSRFGESSHDLLNESRVILLTYFTLKITVS